MPLINKNIRQKNMDALFRMCLGMPSSRWFDNGIGLASDQITTDAREPNRLYGVPILFDQGVTLDRIAVEPTQGSNSGLLYFGIYSNQRAAPTKLMTATQGVSFGSSVVEQPINVSLDAGWYWLTWMHTHNTNRNFRSYNYIEGQASLGFGTSTDTDKSLFIYADVQQPGIPETFPAFQYGQDKPPRILVRTA